MAKRKSAEKRQRPAVTETVNPGQEKRPSMLNRCLDLLFERKYTDQAINECLQEEFPDKNAKGYASFARSGLNKGTIGKRRVGAEGIQLPLEKIVAE